MKIMLNVRHVSIWDSSSVIAVDAKLDIETGKISDIEPIDMNGLCVLDSENIIITIEDITKVCKVIRDNDGDYAIGVDDLNTIRNSINTSSIRWINRLYKSLYLPISAV
jgi:hypothetical protein